MSELAKAVVRVMKAVTNIEKAMTVGTGNSSYKGVADKDVKSIIGKAMADNGLCILPVDIESKVTIERWTENTNYGDKVKQSVFNDVVTKYLLLHESGESQIIVGSGHGVDSMDKAAGKATTYALKYALLYTFMVPTGNIDDADNVHSDSVAKPNKTSDTTKHTGKQITSGTKAKIDIDDAKWGAVIKWVVDNKEKGLLWIINKMSEKYELTTEIQQKIEDEVSKK